MSKRLLSIDQALRKIELSLKLQGKLFTAEFLTCSHCKFAWRNINTDGAHWDRSGSRRHCGKYQNSPSHAWIRYKVIRKNDKGEEIYYPGATRWDWEQNKHRSTIRPGETDELKVVQSMRRGVKRVCRRFEASRRK